MVGHAEAILQKLELPYRVMLLCTGDMGFGAARPTTSKSGCRRRTPTAKSARCSNCDAFQARRMQARFKNAQGKTELVHTLNGSGLAVGRTLVAILENGQNADGSVTIPEALRPYMGGLDELRRMTRSAGEIAAELIAARDGARAIPTPTAADPAFAMADAYAVADEIRRLRIARGEATRGYKIGFTNRGIWARYGVFGADLGPGLGHDDRALSTAREASVSLAPFCEPRLEPEIMFGFARAPSRGHDDERVRRLLEWVAHGFEIVHTHFAGWKFAAADSFADFALARPPLRRPARADGRLSRDARRAARGLARHARLRRRDVEEGRADIVLDGPLNALRLWVDAMAAQPQRWPIVAGDIVTTGTITDAAPLLPATLADAAERSALRRR